VHVGLADAHVHDHCRQHVTRSAHEPARCTPVWEEGRSACVPSSSRACESRICWKVGRFSGSYSRHCLISAASVGGHLRYEPTSTKGEERERLSSTPQCLTWRGEFVTWVEWAAACRRSRRAGTPLEAAKTQHTLVFAQWACARDGKERRTLESDESFGLVGHLVGYQLPEHDSETVRWW
jgi:hypothetical protein